MGRSAPGCTFWQIFPICRLSFHFVYSLLCCAKHVSLIRFHLFFSCPLFLLLLPWETDLRRHWYDLYHNILFRILRVFWCFISVCLCLTPFWVYFLCMLLGCALTLLVYMQLSNCPNTTLLNTFFHCIFFAPFCRRLIDYECVGLFLGSLFCSVHCPHACLEQRIESVGCHAAEKSAFSPGAFLSLLLKHSICMMVNSLDLVRCSAGYHEVK